MRLRSFTVAIFFLFAFTISASAQTFKDGDVVYQSNTLKTIKLKVGGINCSADCKDIQSAVSNMSGVNSCFLKGKPGTTTAFQVTFDPSLVSEKDIRQVVEATPGCGDPDARPYKVKG